MLAPVVEIMSSIQGEGLLVGCRQIFIRLAGCNLRCTYCDTTDSLTPPAVCRVELTPGQRDFLEVPNLLSVERVVELVKHFPVQRHHSVSLTGGEPLLHVDFLKLLLPQLRVLGTRLFLETNGTLADALTEVRYWFDYISMDIKLPGQTSGELWTEHDEFLRVALDLPSGRSGEGVYVKIVITPDTTLAEFDQAVALIANHDRNIPLILQPVTPTGHVEAAPSPKAMLDWQERAAQWLHQVRVIPQLHKILRQL
ncbi:MAG: 7-carboxy-7-deazaguanine synthase QueE [Firmicutes bacterium]|nr:7-carboxy-7-deazaguanine synthase QueE [Bacillota bacterium]